MKLHKPNCFCEGLGYIEDAIFQQTLPCPFGDPEPILDSPHVAWLTQAKKVPAQYHGTAFEGAPSAIVIHRAVTNGMIHRYFQHPDREVSAHFIVGEPGPGDLIQCVSLHDEAWHAGPWNARSVGIEMHGATGSRFETADIDRLMDLMILLISVTPSINTLVGHSDIAPGRRTDPGANFPWSRFRDLPMKCPHVRS